jgi:hypothetical protein
MQMLLPLVVLLPLYRLWPYRLGYLIHLLCTCRVRRPVC